MGIRIHKFLGYGLTDVKADINNWIIIDDRFNPDSKVTNWDYLDSEERLDDYKEFLKGKMKKTKYKEGGKVEKIDSDEMDLFLELHFLNNKDVSLFDCVEYDMEFGMENVILFIPPGHGDDWHRYDDVIDYYEFYYHYDVDNDSDMTFVKELKMGIYPYDYGYCDKRTGERLDNLHVRGHLQLKMERMKQSFEEKNILDEYYIVLNESAKKLGFKNSEDADENMLPEVPDSIRAWCEYLKVFKDEKTVYQLKPMIYQVWR